MLTRHRITFLPLTLLLAACGSDDDASPPPTCQLGVELSGVDGLPAQRGEPTCVGMPGTGAGVRTDFLYLYATGTLWLTLDVHDVTEGEVGAGFPGTIEVRLENGDTWQTPARSCSVDLTEHSYVLTELFRFYQTAGSGSCDMPAEAVGGEAGGQLVVGPFDFRAQVMWSG